MTTVAKHIPAQKYEETLNAKPIYYMYYIQFYQFEIFAKKLLKNKGNNKKMCDIFHHNFKKNIPCYGTAKKKRPGYLVGNLVATNWPIEKALHAIGYNQIPTK